MKRFFVFTLTALFAITCLLVGNLLAWDSSGDYGYADMPFDDVYGYVYVTVWYEPGVFTAYSSHHFFLDNGDDLAINYSYSFHSEVNGPADIEPQGKGDAGQVAVNQEALDSASYSYDMAGKDGNFTIRGSSFLSIDGDTDHDGEIDAWDSWSTPPCSVDFEL